MDEFCATSYAVALQLPQTADEDLDLYASTALPRIEGVFEDFFRSYEKYRVDLAAWNQQYGPPTVTTTVQGYANPLDPAQTLAPGETIVGTMPATQPVIVASDDAAPIDLPPAAGEVPQPIETVPTAPSTAPTITLPTEGPIFRSGEVVQSEDSTVTSGADDTPVP